MTYVLTIILGMFIGFFTGYVMALIGQRELEKEYTRCGIAKLCGGYYSIKKISPKDNNDEDLSF